MENNYDYLFKLVLVGDSNVGKTSLLTRYTDSIFSTNYISTIGVDFKIKTIKIDEKLIKLQIWDTAGQERFRTITSGYYRGSHAILVVFDITNDDSFNDLDSWFDEISKHTQDPFIILLANKVDGNPVVDDERINKILEKYKIKIFKKTSAKLNLGVEETFNDICKELMKNFKNIPQNVTNIDFGKTGKKKLCCIG